MSTENTTTDQAIQNVLNDGFQTMTNGERSTNNLSLQDLLALKHEEQKEKSMREGTFCGVVKIPISSTRF